MASTPAYSPSSHGFEISSKLWFKKLPRGFQVDTAQHVYQEITWEVKAAGMLVTTSSISSADQPQNVGNHIKYISQHYIPDTFHGMTKITLLIWK